MNSPAEVAANLERLAADAQRRALGQLSFAGAVLGLLTECVRWSPDDDASIAATVEGYRTRTEAGLAALGEMQRYQRALANLKSPTIGDLPAGAPVQPQHRMGKLNELAAAMIETASDASGNLQALVDIIKGGGPGAAEAICEQMQTFAARSEELQLMFAQAGEVAGCDGSA